MKQKLIIIASLLSLTFYFLSNAQCQWVEANGIDISEVYCFANSGSSLFLGSDSGVLRSTDNGNSWSKTQLKNKKISLLLGTATNLFAVTPYNLLHSTDMGATWIPFDSGLPVFNVKSLAGIGNNLFASTPTGIFRSKNNSSNWVKVTGKEWDSSSIKMLHADSTNVFAAIAHGIILSTDEGATWKAVNVGSNNNIVFIFAKIGSHIFADTYEGIFISNNNGLSWSSRGTNLSQYVYSVATNGKDIYVSTYDGIFSSSDDGVNWTKIEKKPSFYPSNALAISGPNLLAGTRGLYRSEDTGKTWLRVGLYTSAYSFYKLNDTLLVSGSGGTSWSNDNGISWTSSTDELCGGIGSVLSSNNYLYAGTGCNLSRSSDGGKTWMIAGLAGIQVNDIFFLGSDFFACTRNGIYVSPNNNGSWQRGDLIDIPVYTYAKNGNDIYLATENGVFRSEDSCKSWTTANNGLTNTSVYTLAVSGTNLFAGTSGGGFVSGDRGKHWREMNSGLPKNIIYSFAVLGTNIIAGTYGGIFLSSNYGNDWINISDGLPMEPSVYAFYSNDSTIFAGSRYGVWRHPLSELINTNVAEETHQNQLSIKSYPNPFSQSTSIKFSSSEHSFVEVFIYNLLGSEVARLFTGELDAGEHSFSWDAHGMLVGMYICVVKVGRDLKVIPLVLLK